MTSNIDPPEETTKPKDPPQDAPEEENIEEENPEEEEEIEEVEEETEEEAEEEGEEEEIQAEEENPEEEKEPEAQEEIQEEAPPPPPAPKKPLSAIQSPAEKIALDDLPVTLTVELAHIQMSAKKLVELAPGNILDLETSSTSALLTCNGKIVGRGEILKIGDTLGVRILELGK